MSSNKRLQAVQNIGKALALILAVFSTLSYIISMTIGPILFFSTTDGLTVAARQIHQIPIDVFMVITIPVPVGVNLGVLFAGIWAFFRPVSFLLGLVVVALLRLSGMFSRSRFQLRK